MSTGSEMPGWLCALDDEDRAFLKRFALASGSLKELAGQYGISYPTIRSRLDRLIAKIQAAEDPKAVDDFERRLRVLTVEGTISLPAAKELLAAHRSSLKTGSKS